MTITIRSCNMEEVQKKLEKLAKKANRYGVAFEWNIGDEYPKKLNVYAYDDVNHVQYVSNTFTVAARDVEIVSDGLIRQNGWKVLARIEHGAQGNIVFPFDCEAPEEWYTCKARCDHCGANRFRKVTYIVEQEDGSRKQVGKTCLKEYTGIAPESAALWAEARSDLERDEFYGGGSPNQADILFPVRDVLACAYDSIKDNGYRKSDSIGSTKDDVLGRIAAYSKMTDEGLSRADEIIDWLSSLETTNDLERNCISLAKSGYAKRRHFGMLAYMPVAYERDIERKAREAERAAAKASSEFVGAVGERITVKADSARLLTSWETMYGWTYLYKFVSDGNVFVWFASRPIEADDGITIKGTVKAHSERDGEKQTVLTRCKIA